MVGMTSDQMIEKVSAALTAPTVAAERRTENALPDQKEQEKMRSFVIVEGAAMRELANFVADQAAEFDFGAEHGKNLARLEFVALYSTVLKAERALHQDERSAFGDGPGPPKFVTADVDEE